MTEVSVAEAKANLSKILDRVEAGELVTITRRGRAIASLSAIRKVRKPIDFDALREFREAQREHARSSAEVIRDMRDESW